MHTRLRRRVLALTLASALTVTVGACTNGGPLGSGDSSNSGSNSVTLLTHQSFALPDRLIAEFEKDTGLKLDIQRIGDAGELSNIVSLSSGSPRGDAVFGIDNTFAARVLDANALDPYTSPLSTDGADTYDIKGAEDKLTAIDHGDVCVNVDDAWFDREGIAPPTSLQDLTNEKYRDRIALLDPSTSSPGMGFLLATIGTFADKAPDYWRSLMDNGAQVVPGWEVAYNQLFTAGEGHGPKPIVVSYASSPAATPGTSAILSGCFAQVEYIGVLRGAANTKGAGKLIDWMLSPKVQAALPTSMYVYPVQNDTPMPQDWRLRAPAPEYRVTMTPSYINDNREQWIKRWQEIVRK